MVLKAARAQISARTLPVPDRYVSGRIEIRPAERQLLVDGQSVSLGGRAFDLLLVLMQHRARVVTKHELLDLVWPGLVVEENNLQVQVSSLRKLLGPHALLTVPGHGYRFTLAEDTPANAPSQRLPIAAGSAGSPSAQNPTNLPAALPPLYGRDADLDAISACIDAHRLVTIIGAGGIGKTRLAQAAAHGLREHYPDGVWLVELAPLTDDTMLPASVAHALGLALHGQHAPSDELVVALEAQRLLLILDNCEHLIDAAAALSQGLLDRAPGVHLLLTSQAPLGLPAEHLFRLKPLAVPQDVEWMWIERSTTGRCACSASG